MKIKKYNDSSAAHKIAIYIRVSGEEQAENPEGSIKSQEQDSGNTSRLRTKARALENWSQSLLTSNPRRTPTARSFKSCLPQSEMVRSHSS